MNTCLSCSRPSRLRGARGSGDENQFSSDALSCSADGHGKVVWHSLRDILGREGREGAGDKRENHKHEQVSFMFIYVEKKNLY